MTQDQVSLQNTLNVMTLEIAILSDDGAIVVTNTAWQNSLRHDRAGPYDIAGRHVREAFRSVDSGASSDLAWILQGIEGVLQGRLPGFDFEYRAGRSARVRWLHLSATPLPEGPWGALITRRDITLQKTSEAGLLSRANNDALTGIANRSYFLLEGALMLALAKRNVWHPALVYLDIDDFKGINDEYGHAVGDAVLERVGARLQRLTRESDLVARLGGDEFVVLLSNVTVENSGRIVQVYRRSLAQPPIIDGMPIIIQASFGVAHYPADGVTVEALLAVADRAMYIHKASRPRRRSRRGSGGAIGAREGHNA